MAPTVATHSQQVGRTLGERAVALARERGEVRTAELTAIGIPRCYLSRMCDEGLLLKVGYGRYRAADLNPAILLSNDLSFGSAWPSRGSAVRLRPGAFRQTDRLR